MIDVEVTVEHGEERDFLGELAALVEGSALTRAVATAAYGRWTALAIERLTKTRAAYLAGLQPPVMNSDGSATVELTTTPGNPIPAMVEAGMSPHDMKQTHLRGALSKVMTFERGLPSSTAATPLSYGYGGRGADVARSIGRHVAKHVRHTPPGGTVASGLAPRIKPGLHVVDPYAGARRSQSGELTVFRTLSANARPDAWQHPGIEARALADQVAADMDTIAPAVIESVLRAILGS